MSALARGADAVRAALVPGSSVRRPLGAVRRGSARAYRRATAGDRMLPTVIVIGAQKGGTSSLHEYIAAHPDVGRPSLKEIHYFDDNNVEPLAWYKAHFPRAGRFRDACEASPYYLFHPRCPDLIRSALPDVKLVALLRDPVERAYSHYQMNHAFFGYETLDFGSALDREDDRLAGEEERIIGDPGYRSFAHKHFSYVGRGMYARQLERWYAEFPREQLFVAPSESLFADPARVLHDIQDWLGLARHTPADLRPRNTRSYTSIEPEIAAKLRARFGSDSAQLTELTGVEFPWASNGAG